MTDAFLDKAEKKIMALLDNLKPELMQSYGLIEHDIKYDNSVVTHLDKMVEEELRSVLRSLDPNIGIEGEEFGIEGNRDTYWLVDPIDGTEQFIRGIPSCKNLLALVENGEVVWSLMNMFARDELWLARKGQGVTCNGQKVTMRYRPLERSWIDMNVNLLEPKNVEALVRTRPHLAGYVIFRDTTNVISGKIDGVICIGSKGGAWDYAPRSLMYQEAGAMITNIGLETYDFRNNDFLVAHPKNFDALMSLVTGS